MSVSLSHCKEIGRGSYGKVYVGKSGGKDYAVKRRYIINTAPPGCIHVNEIDIMCRFNHPHILRALSLQKQNPISDSFRSDKHNPLGESTGVTYRADLVYIITEAAHGDLASLWLMEDSSKEILNEKAKNKLRKCMYQILHALAYIHKNNYIHRDIKPANILYTEQNEEFNTLICDFDMCMPNIPGFLSDKAMTPEYTPPEILTQGIDVLYTPKVDIWGAGHIIYHLIHGRSPIRRGNLRGDELDYFILAMEKQFFPNGISIDTTDFKDVLLGINLTDKQVSFDMGDSEVSDLITHMLDCDPNTRWSAEQCLAHSFFTPITTPLMSITDEDDFIIANHHITDEMATIFDDKIKVISTQSYYGFFLGLDILMRVCTEKRKGNGKNLAICCYNIGMKYFYKESGDNIPIDAETAKRIEYNIIAEYLKGKIYRETAYSRIEMRHDLIYKILLAKAPLSLLPCKFSAMIGAIGKRLSELQA